ncbi:MAG: helix-turn-helix transcriptional regulator [Aristaeellaceae bacterium]
MKDRIKQIRKDLGLTQAEFGEALGTSRIAVTTYETGRVVPDKSVQLLICEKFNVNEDWLETGEGLPYREGLIPGLVHALSCMPDVRAMLEEKLPNVSDESWRKLNEAFKAFLNDMK